MAQLQIDGEKLRQRLLDVGVKPSAASTEIGFSANYWGKAMKSGVCSEIAANALQMRYGINPDDYTVKDEEPPVSPAQQTCEQTTMLPAPDGGETGTFSLAALRGVICEAICDAAVQIAADKGLQDALNRVIYGAVFGAGINLERVRGGCVMCL